MEIKIQPRKSKNSPFNDRFMFDVKDEKGEIVGSFMLKTRNEKLKERIMELK